MPSGSTRLTVASLYSLPLTVLKSSANVSAADRAARIAMIVFRRAPCVDSVFLLSTPQQQNDFTRSNPPRIRPFHHKHCQDFIPRAQGNVFRRYAVIRVYDAIDNMLETHEHAGDFKEW